MAEKPVIWIGTARDDLLGFPADARHVAGFQLWRIQRGLEHRVFSLAKFDEAVYVLHAF